MDIILGQELDKGSYPDALGDAEATLGNVVIGPSGLTGILETRLGLAKSRPHEAVRIGHYLKIMREVDDGARFYSRSLAADAWSTAKTVLAWRDELRISGWNGEAPVGVSERLTTIGEIEKRFQNDLIEGIGDRVQSILPQLNGRQALGISQIQLVEPIESWASGWRTLIEALKKYGVNVSDVLTHAGDSSGDLGRLQEALGTRVPIKDAIVGDGSLCLVRSPGEWEACETIASLLESIQKSDRKTVIIDEGGSHSLDDILNRHNLPRLGYDSRSRWRTALQLLPLVLSNYWKPLDAQKLLEFLIIPKSPISRDAGVFLEKALREHPGIGGPKWIEAMERALGQHDSYSFDGETEPETPESLEEYRKELGFWLGEIERFVPDDGIPCDVVMEICSCLNKWAAKRGGTDSDNTLIASAKLFKDVSQAVRDSGLSKITQPQLHRVLDSVIGEGLERPDYGPQESPWARVNSPGQVWGTADTIIWWNFASDGVTPLYSPWTSAEKDSLNAQGVKLRGTDEIRLMRSSSWRNAVMFAGKRLALAVPLSVGGKGLNYHPFWDEIRYLLNLDERSIQRLAFDGPRIWREESPDFFGEQLIRKPLPNMSPPRPERVWLVPADRLKGRVEESYSSVQSLIECPFAWVCKHVLELNPGTLAVLPERWEMLGTLSHAVMERTLRTQPFPSPEAAENIALGHFDELVPQMASCLLFPERKSELEQVRGRIGVAARILVGHIESSGLNVRNQEDSIRRELNDKQHLNGRIDLALGDDTENKVVVDLKWSSYARYKREELEKGGPFQLAAYAWLLRNPDNEFPAGAYYMLAQGELISSECEFLPTKCVFPDVDLKSIWTQCMSSYETRLGELKGGKAVAAGVSAEPAPEGKSEETGQDEEPELALDLKPKCDWCPYANLCGLGVK